MSDYLYESDMQKYIDQTCDDNFKSILEEEQQKMDTQMARIMARQFNWEPTEQDCKVSLLGQACIKIFKQELAKLPFPRYKMEIPPEFPMFIPKEKFKYMSGAITILFPSLNLNAEEIAILTNLLKYCVSVEIDTNLNGTIEVSFNVPYYVSTQGSGD